MTPVINQWAIRHGVSYQAMQELRALMGLDGGHEIPDDVKGVSEGAVQAAVRRESAQKGLHLWRNNVGVLEDINGTPVRFGLANDKKQLNAKIKSGDLIGWRPILIGPEHVGLLIAQFVSREIKKVGWHYTGVEREPAQLAWANLVMSAGGDAGFAAGVGTL